MLQCTGNNVGHLTMSLLAKHYRPPQNKKTFRRENREWEREIEIRKSRFCRFWPSFYAYTHIRFIICFRVCVFVHIGNILYYRSSSALYTLPFCIESNYIKSRSLLLLLCLLYCFFFVVFRYWHLLLACTKMTDCNARSIWDCIHTHTLRIGFWKNIVPFFFVIHCLFFFCCSLYSIQ